VKSDVWWTLDRRETEIAVAMRADSRDASEMRWCNPEMELRLVSAKWIARSRGRETRNRAARYAQLYTTKDSAGTTTMASPLFFSTFEVTRQAFHRTALAYAIVNLKPIVPGRTCVAPAVSP
jgi:hypothetical protein